MIADSLFTVKVYRTQTIFNSQPMDFYSKQKCMESNARLEAMKTHNKTAWIKK